MGEGWRIAAACRVVTVWPLALVIAVRNFGTRRGFRSGIFLDIEQKERLSCSNLFSRLRLYDSILLRLDEMKDQTREECI